MTLDQSLSALRARQDPTRVPDMLPELAEALAEAQEQRDQRRSLDSHGAPAWVAHERAVMVDATTALLVRHELPIDAQEVAEAVARAEDRASGHSDYTRKWALGCAEYIAELATATADTRKERAQ